MKGCNIVNFNFLLFFIILILGVVVTTLAVVVLFIHSASAQICTVGTYAGTGVTGFSGDGGDAISAKFGNTPISGVWVDTSNKLFVVDNFNNRVREVNPNTKIVVTIAGFFFFFFWKPFSQ
jgi:hypothetical protein